MNRPGFKPLAVAVLLLGGCAPGNAVSGGPDESELWGRTFLSVAAMSGTQMIRLVPGTRITLTFERGLLRADAGCNQISGEVTLRDGRLTLHDASQTMMGCDQELHEQDAWLTKFLKDRPRWRLEEDRLFLSSGSTEVQLVDRRADEPDRQLQGTTWSVEAVIDQGSIATAPAGGEAYLRFLKGGRVDGSTGCQRLSGRAQVSGGTIRFEGKTVETGDCPRALRQLHASVAALLEGEVTYRIEADRMVLIGADGRGLQLRAKV